MSNLVTYKTHGGTTVFTIDASGNVTGDAVTVDSLTTSGALSAASLAATGAVTCASMTASGAVTAGSVACATVPEISTGTAAPSSTPGKVGDIFVDTATPDVYVAKAATASTDWVKVT